MSKRRKNNIYHKPKNIRGQGSIYYSKHNDKWVGQVPTYRKENGKKAKLTVYGNTPREARKKLEQAKLEEYFLLFLDKRNVTIFQMGKYLINDKLQSNEIQEVTYRKYKDLLKRLSPISHIKIIDVSPAELQKYMVSIMDYSQSSIKKIKNLLIAIFNLSITLKVIKTNPMDYVVIPKSNKKTKIIRSLTIDEEIRFVDILLKLKPSYWQQMYISLFTGMRIGEINALLLNDINIERKQIYIDKTVSLDSDNQPFINPRPKTEAGERIIPINNSVYWLFEEILNTHNFTNSELLFNKEKNKYSKELSVIRTNCVYSSFMKVIKSNNIIDHSISGNINLHSLRHTYATRCIEAGMNIKVLEKLLGHTEISTTINTYTNVFDEFKNNSIKMVDEYMKSINIG